ncbi:aldo/keto reductase [Rheinheimera sp. UJ51]|uniref:aldo/keto reductase n=1 Tax=Rheinheimera sp. UJ51 TaxID=2892446 RepID=UPI001E523D71|nr:aldo/keto reductase [Rheinheimera sp. UJ51]MCC5452907.1 aldo/keto reductase [Rheinheimera sp. UJ51]
MSISNMPLVGLGLWKIAKEDCAKTVYDAIAAGYRHLDSACDYGNEVQVGLGIKQAIDDGLCHREDLWITSKLWNTYHAPENVQPALEKSLKDLGLDYLDLYLIHFPIAQAFVPFELRYPPEWFFDPQVEKPTMKLAKVPLYQTWAAMENLVEQGLVKHIGVCNYNSALIHDLMTYAIIPPAVLQIESHPYNTQEKLIATCNAYGIKVTAFSPLGALSYLELDMAKQEDAVIHQDVVLAAAKRLQKTPAQIVLRWNIQRGCAIIPKSTKLARLKENIALFDFELNLEEMTAISALNRNKRFNDPGEFCQAAFNTFHAIYD